MDAYNTLKLENQLCFPLYACAREVVRLYTPHLNELSLTYTQYITMMVLWQESENGNNITVKALGQRLMLDTGTLTPLLKKLESKGLVVRARDTNDERNLRLTLTNDGIALREKALAIPTKIGSCIPLDPAEAATLYQLLYKIINKIKES